MALVLPSMSHQRGRSLSLKESSQIRGIHQSWTVFSREFNGIFPTPGLISRQAVNGTYLPGAGAEDQLANNTANIHSACIAQNYYTPELCVGPTEPSAKVFVKEDFDWVEYRPECGVFWDQSFKCDLQSESNVSFANMPVAGERKLRQWRESFDPAWAMIGTRGVRNGSLKPEVFDQSITLRIHGDRSTWEGNICFNDNHVEYLNTFTPAGQYCRDSTGAWQQDNIFRNDNFGVPSAHAVSGTDCWLAITLRLCGTPDHVTDLCASWD
jgi:hypothetical protein